MTTIAYRQGVLAGDKRTTWGSTRLGPMPKVFKREDGALIGGAGYASVIQRYIDWFLAGEKAPRPSLVAHGEADKDACTALLIVRPNGDVEVHDDNGMFPAGGSIIAIGSGADLAYGAMEMGADAKQAVLIAAKRDINTGDGVHCVSLA